MSEVSRDLQKRRMQLVARSTQQRQQLLQAWPYSQLARPEGVVWGQLWRWRWPLVTLLVPCAMVAFQRPCLIFRCSKWLLPAWQGWRAAQRLVQTRSSLDIPRS